MKIDPDTEQRIRAKMIAVRDANPDAERNYRKENLSATRYFFDLFWAAKAWDELPDGNDILDAHIATVLRRLARDVDTAYDPETIRL
jgi:hypothetical protein